MTRRATIRTHHDDAQSVAAAVEPDNTAEMETVVEADAAVVETRIDRASTGGLHATVDDYLVNLHVAEQCTNDATTNNTQ
jgi:hypothetical protein